MSRCFLGKMLKKLFPITVIVLMFTFLSINVLFLDLHTVSANGYEAGVKIGDWIEYEVNFTESTPPIYPLRTRREILDVKGTVLTINTTYALSDGTFTTNTSDGDVVDGSGSCALAFVPANLGIGDFFYISSLTDDPIIVSAETTRSYLGVTRTVIYSEFAGKGIDISVYWDKEKGAALEIHGVGTYTSTSQIIGTNMWGSSDGSNVSLEVWVFLTIMISLACILVYGYINSQRNTRRRTKRTYR